MQSKALLFLALLTSAAFAITDCEICQLISGIYGACSPELVELYANKTGLGEVEWKCLLTSPITSENATDKTPAYAIVMQNQTIALYTIYGTVWFYPASEYIENWSYSYDGIGDTFSWSITYNATATPVKRTLKILAPFKLARNGTKLEYKNVFLNLAAGTPITKISNTADGLEMDLAVASLNGTFTISGTVGKLDACTIACFDETDFVFLYCECSSCTNVEVGNTFGYDRTKWSDILATCTVSAGCVIDYEYDPGSGYLIIPTNNAAANIDCNNTNCKTSAPSKNTWYYKYPKCRNVGSGNVRTRFNGLDIYSTTRGYSCIAAPTPSASVPIIEEEEFSRTDYMPYLGGLGVFALIALGVFANGPMVKKKYEEDEEEELDEENRPEEEDED